MDKRPHKQKSQALFDEFTRKQGANKSVNHYCPGCGHGTAHNLIAEAIQDFDIQDRTIFCSPVGCSVFAYYYFDCGNVQCAHGRAPAVATGIRRTHKDAIIISYQGDGDLAGIGLSHIIQAANRGENITVYFINNAIYGMTGGQMAPTTLLNQKTTTTPMGRSAENDGFPMGMAELIGTLDAPVYVERVSLADPKRLLRARRAIRKGLKNQVDRKGFSFVEILSPCPINWRMSPTESRVWIKETLEPVFPLQVFKDISDEAVEKPGIEATIIPDEDLRAILLPPAQGPAGQSESPSVCEDQHVKIAGFGGQGVLSAGILLANCAIAEGLQTTWLPSYGPEMRGGTANAGVKISAQTIGSPIVSVPNVLLAMNQPSLDTFEPQVAPGALIVVNASLIDRHVTRTDVHSVYVPATDMARDLGNMAVANVIMLAVYFSLTGVVSIEALRRILPSVLKKASLVELNMKAIAVGVAFCKERTENRK